MSHSPKDWAAPFHLDPGSESPDVVRMFVEVPKGSRNKYELDKSSGLVRLDRHLYSSSHYPGDYGFVPSTLADDGDSLDAIVMLNDPTFSGCLIDIRVLGMFRMTDGGKEDVKILGCPSTDPLFESLEGLSDVPVPFVREVEYFFTTYKVLEGAEVRSLGWADRADAIKAIELSVAAFGRACEL